MDLYGSADSPTESVCSTTPELKLNVLPISRIEYLRRSEIGGGKMQMRVGIDLVSVTDVSHSIAQFRHRFLERIFTPRELEDCAGEADQFASRLAARFAAKEAATKVLCPGDLGVGWKSIEIERAPEGCTNLTLHGPAAALALEQGLTTFALSLSHEGAYAAAVVVAS